MLAVVAEVAADEAEPLAFVAEVAACTRGRLQRLCDAVDAEAAAAVALTASLAFVVAVAEFEALVAEVAAFASDVAAFVSVLALLSEVAALVLKWLRCSPTCAFAADVTLHWPWSRSLHCSQRPLPKLRRLFRKLRHWLLKLLRLLLMWKHLHTSAHCTSRFSVGLSSRSVSCRCVAQTLLSLRLLLSAAAAAVAELAAFVSAVSAAVFAVSAAVFAVSALVSAVSAPALAVSAAVCAVWAAVRAVSAAVCAVSAFVSAVSAAV